MGITPDTMRLIMAVCLLGMALLSVFYLRKRALTYLEYLGWGLLIILVPLLGPFLVIYLRPGRFAQQAK
ncbi:MAG: hypothetical protein JSV61_00220 [Anaerolineales bacterium]|nr:MAG: hypothetical protein JSV61_00220 [Anaerolineales bacterium]